MAQTNLPHRIEQAIALIRRDPKKSGILGVLLVVMVLIGIRRFGPARPAPVSGAAPIVHRGSGNAVSTAAKVSGPTIDPRMQKWGETPVSPLTRNLFSIQLEYFPVEGPRKGEDIRAMEEDGFWARLEKSLAHQADQKDKREIQIAHFKAQAARLKLGSTIMGPVPKAMVNGELVGEGDVVASFRVLKIEARRVIVEREGIRLEIHMK